MSFPILRQPSAPRFVDDIVGMATTRGLAYFDCVDCGVEFSMLDDLKDPACPTCGTSPLCPACMENHVDDHD